MLTKGDPAYRYDGDLKVESEKIIVTVPLVPNRDINQILILRT